MDRVISWFRERYGCKREVERWKDDPLLRNSPYLGSWELMEVPVDWSIVRKLLMSGVVKKVAKKDYMLVDREAVKRAIQEYESYAKFEFEPRAEQLAEIPQDLFSTIVGYDDVKKLFMMSLKAERPTHVLMVGPPASSKTVFLLEIARLKGAFYLLGGSTKKAGLLEQLFQLRPSYVLLDEIDKMDAEDFTALLSLMETGIVKEVKYGKTREMTLPARVYAACNVEESLPPELLSRFQFKLHFKPYTREEFVEVARKVLVMREGKSEEIASYIAEKVADLSRDVRECVGIARLASTREEVDFLVEIKRKYMGGASL